MNYYEISIKSNITQEILDYAFNLLPWMPYYNFSAKPLPLELIVKDNFFKWLNTRYEFIAGVLRLEPYTCYNWHKDTKRGVGINMLLTPNVRSVCAFADNIDNMTFKIQELVYKPNTYYVFNTQNNHTVYNFDKTRYLLSIEFAKEKNELSFDDLVNDIKHSQNFNHPMV